MNKKYFYRMLFICLNEPIDSYVMLKSILQNYVFYEIYKNIFYFWYQILIKILMNILEHKY